MALYPVRALERAMKISEVITRAISGKINWIQAAEILGMSDRQLRRWRKRWDKCGVLIIAGVIALASGRTADTDRERLLRASGKAAELFPCRYWV